MTEKSFKILFDAHFDEIRRYLFFRSGDTVLSTDLAQDTFMKVWEKQMELAPGKDAALLYKIAGDLFLSYIRRERLSKKIHHELKLDIRNEDTEQGIHYRELKKRYQKALMRLPGKQRTVFLMSRMDGFSYPEISERLAISIKAVEKRMSAALKHLRKELDAS